MPQPISSFVVDDESPARRRIVELLAQQPDVELTGEFDRGATAIEAIRQSPPDLLFLDIQMPELSGFDVLDAVGIHQIPVTIFVTAYDAYALKAFDVHALDYLLKPFSDERFEAALTRARGAIRSKQREAMGDKLVRLMEEFRSTAGGQGPVPVPGTEAPYLDRIVVKSAGKVVFLDLREIEWIEAAGVYVRLHTADKRHLLRETLGSLESQLDPRRFVRIHRSSIVPVDRIAELEQDRGGTYRVRLRNGSALKLSRGYRDQLQRAMGMKI
jgi:two-component system LytT family response regulator